MKKTLSLILALVMVATMFAVITVPASAAVEPKVNASVYDGTMDKTWYNPEAPATEYTLTTAAQLAGLADWVNTDGVKFEGVTIKLGADIIWNEGTFTLGKDNKTPVYNGALVDATVKTWPVIGTRDKFTAGNNDIAATDGGKYFCGTFDGQGHIISGLYVNDTGYGAGLFSNFAGPELKNVSIINSFITTSSRSASFAAFVATGAKNAGNDFAASNLYSNAYVVLTNPEGNVRSGGLFGMIRNTKNISLDKVWYDGTIVAIETDKNTPFIGGFVGVICSEDVTDTISITNSLMTGSIYAISGVDVATTENQAMGGLVANIYSGRANALTIENCLVAVKDTNVKEGSTDTFPASNISKGAFVARFEKCANVTATYTNSYYIPNGYFNTINGKHSAEGNYSVKINDTEIGTATADILATAKIEKIADATGLSTEVFDLTGETAALKTVKTKIEAVVDVWDGTADTTWFDAANVAEEYVLTTAEQFAGFAKLVDEGNKFENVTIKLGANITLNEGTFKLGYDKKTAVYNDKLIDAENPVNVWNPIGASYNGGNECDVHANASFWGAFDGQGFVISGMYVNDPASQQQGLFGTFAGTSIKNVVITNSYVCGESRNGSLVGFISNNNKSNEDKSANGDTSVPATHDVVIENIYSDAIVVSMHTTNDVRSGGIVGISRRAKAITYKNLTFEGAISAIAVDTSKPARNYGGVIGVTVDDKADGTVYENIVNKGAMYADSVHTDAQTGAIVGNHCFGNFTMTNCVSELKDTNMTVANGFAAEHAIKDEAGTVIGYDLKGTTTTYSAFVGCLEKNTTVATYENCSYTHIGVFVSGLPEMLEGATVNGKGLAEWKAEGAGDIEGGVHGGFVEAKDATCEEAGNLAHYNCSCGLVLDAEGKETTLEAVTLAPAHNYGEWVAPVEPTATEAGVLGHYQCSACQKYFDADKNELASIEGAPALGNGTEQQPGNTEQQPGNTEQQPGNTEGDQPANTTKPATTEPAKKKGCGGFTAVGAVLALVAVMGAAIVIKKK